MNSYIVVAAVKPEIEHSDTPAIVGLGTLALAVIGFLAAWAFHQIVSSWKEDHTELRDQVNTIVLNQATFVRRDDYLRGMESIDKKLDALAIRQDQQVLRQDGQFQILLNRLTLSRNSDSNDRS